MTERVEFYTATGGHVLLDPVSPEHFDPRMALCGADHKDAILPGGPQPAGPAAVTLTPDECLRLGTWLLTQVLHDQAKDVLVALVRMARHVQHIDAEPPALLYPDDEPF